MMQNIIKKIVKCFITLFVIINIIILLLECIPGKIYDDDKMRNDAYIENISNKYNLNQTFLGRYFNDWESILKLNFGESYIFQGRQVNDIIKDDLGTTMFLAITSVLLSFIIGSCLGITFSKRSNKFIKFATILSTFILSFPVFVIAVLLQFYLCIKVKIFPIIWSGNVSTVILPVLCLSIFPTIYITRILRNSMNKEYEKDYYLSLKVNGMKNYYLIVKYCFRNTITPILSYIGMLFGNIVISSFVIEKIFNIPGVGRDFVYAITSRDYPVILALSVIFSTIIIITNTFAEILVILSNPELRKEYNHV